MLEESRNIPPDKMLRELTEEQLNRIIEDDHFYRLEKQNREWSYSQGFEYE